MSQRTEPCSAFDFLVDWGGDRDPAADPCGGFAEVTGLDTGLSIAEYRDGSDSPELARKVSGIPKTREVTCKRGVIGSTDFCAWIEQARTPGSAALRTVRISLYDEARRLVCQWLLGDAIPTSYTGPAPVSPGDGDVAVDEIVFSVRGIELVGS